MTISISKAYCGYSHGSRAYVPYSGRLTNVKLAKIERSLVDLGYSPGWQCTNVSIEPCDEGYSYTEDGAGGWVKDLKVIEVHLQGDKK